MVGLRNDDEEAPTVHEAISLQSGVVSPVFQLVCMALIDHQGHTHRLRGVESHGPDKNRLNPV